MKLVFKRKHLLFVSIVFLIFLLAGIFIYMMVFNDGVDLIAPKELLYKCEEFGCIQSDEKSDEKSIPVTITSFGDSGKNYLLNIEIWDANTNNIMDLDFKVERSLLTEFDLKDGDLPKNLILKIYTKKNVVPLPYISDYFNKIIFVTESIQEVSFVDTQKEYLNEENVYNYEYILSGMKESLTTPEGVSELGRIPSKLFVFNNVLSYGYLDQTDYDRVLLYEILDIAKDKSSEDLSDNCTILKKYYPNNQCNQSFSDLKTPLIDQILHYDIPHYDIKKIVTDSIVANTDAVKKVRSDSSLWAEYYSSKNLTLANEIEKYNRSFLEFMYSSNFSCSDEKYSSICDQVNRLYEYSKFLVSLSEGNLCTHISYLPLLASVSEDEDIIKELEYVLKEYPFTSECIYSNESSGFCSVDLEERFSCMKLMYESVDLFGDDYKIIDNLKEVTDFTLKNNLDIYEDKIGLWGKEDINLLNFGDLGESYYPVKFYDINGNYVFYKILSSLYND